MLGPNVGESDVACRRRGTDRIRAGLDPIRQDPVVDRARRLDALDHDRVRTRPQNPAAGLVEELREVLNLRFASGVLDRRGAIGDCPRHDEVSRSLRPTGTRANPCPVELVGDALDIAVFGR